MKKIQEDSNCRTHFEHFLESILCILYVVSKLGKSNASNGVQIRAEMKKLWPLEENRAKLRDNFASYEISLFLRN